MLVRLTERRDRVAKASWRTLCRESGISKRDTPARHLRRLTKPWDSRVDGTPVTIPVLLRQRSGTVSTGRRPTVWEFRPDGLEALGQLAAELLAALVARKEQLQADRADAVSLVRTL